MEKCNTVIFGVSSRLYTTTAAYARVSTQSQINDNKTSILSQLEEIDSFLRANQLQHVKFGNSITEVNRGNKNIKLEQFLRTHCNLTLCVYDATRFVRSKSRGETYLDIAIKNNISIIFIYNKIIWNPQPDISGKQCGTVRDNLLALFEHAENEPKMISMRITQKIKYCRENFMPSIGIIPYGYKIVEEYDRELKITTRKVVPHEYQMLIIEFIKCARTVGTDLAHFNEFLRKIVEDFHIYRDEQYKNQPFDAYQFYDTNNVAITKIVNPMTYADIASILNYNGILYKNKKVFKWNAVLVRKLANFVPYNMRESTSSRASDAETTDVMQEESGMLDSHDEPNIREITRTFTRLRINGRSKYKFTKYSSNDAPANRTRSRTTNMPKLRPRKLMKYV